ncbi:MAG: response regulator [Dehalococcoidia bacterium]|jgi:CheY-like chemotaxis protein/DNA-directed RNA polymerase subunit RPC12/RpoP
MSQILFLSSDPVLKEKNVEILQQSGLDANGTSGCLDGLVMMDKTNYDVIIIDDELSDVSGYEACLKIRQQHGALIVLLGTIPDSDAWSRVEELGFDLYLRKPISPRELLARTKALLRRPGAEGVAEDAAAKPAAPAPEVAVKPPARSIPGEREAAAPTRAPEPASPGQERIIIRSRPEPQQYEAAPQTQAPPVQQPYVPPAPPVPSTPVSPAPEPPVVVVPRPAAPQIQQQSPVVVPPLGRDIKKPGSPVIVNPPAQQSAYVAKAQPSQEDAGAAILEDPRVIKLVDALVSGKIPDINPVVDFSYKMGYAYPSVSSLIDTSEVETINILESLANAGILIKQPYEKFYVDPDGLFQLVPIERCPRCDSSNIIKGQLVEHFSCGYVGLDKDFKQDSRYVCPKCRKDLRLIGTDYRNVGIHYRCQDCSEVFTVPVVKWRNMKTRKVWSSEDLKEVEASSYQFSPDKKGWLEFQLKPKTQLVDFLKQRGYQVHELAQLTGRSGAVHTVDVLAIRDDIITKVNLGIGILVAPSGEPEVGLESLFRFDTRAYDIGINYKVVIAIPKLGQEALNFAGRQMIRAFEAKTLATVVADITHLDRSNIGMQSRVEEGANHSGSVAANARGIIVRFLRNKGYEVYERALILGKSGIEHIFDIFARRDDKIVVPTIAIGIGNETGQQVGLDELSKFDAAAFDAGIRNKVYLGLSEISTQAKQFAMQQKIDIIEQQDLRKLT